MDTVEPQIMGNRMREHLVSGTYASIHREKIEQGSHR